MSHKQPKKQPDYFTRTFQVAVVIGGFVYGGYAADQGLGLRFPIFTLVLSLIGVALGIYIFVRDSG